jgi:Carboxypeptidase regulatory-like domain/TonB dependent receptor-like, beta-barrel
MKSMHLLVCMIICLSLADAAHGQGVGASGNINGTALDPSGAVVPKANLTAVNTATGARYSAITDGSGQYRFTGLPPATYNLTIHVAGFQTQVQHGVLVTVGETTAIDFHLSVASTGQAVEITAQPPPIDTERGSQANTVSQQYIANLPIDRRDYLSFTLLLPGVSNSTRLADDQDFRVKQTPQSGLSFYGSNGRGNSVTVDGGEDGDDAGGVRATVSQDAVEEFQVNRSNYAADLGGASGGSINIVTKGGTNQFHGSLFGFFRNHAMDAQDPFAFSQALQPGAIFDPTSADSQAVPIKNSLQRYQFGGSAGGPIKKNKTFLFGAFENLRQDAQSAVPLLLNTSILRPTAAQQTVINTLAGEGNTQVTCFTGGPMQSAAVCAAELTAGLTVSQLTGLSAGQNAVNTFLVNQLESNGGLFSYNTRDYLANARLDHRISDADQLTLSYRFAHDLEENPDVQSLTGFSAGSSTHLYDDTILGAWYHQFSPEAQNELRLQWDYESFNVIPNEPGEVGLQIPGFANNLGTNIFLPSLTILRRYEFADNVTLTRGNHTIKFGGSELLRGNHTESHTFFPGRFVFGSLPAELISPQLAATTISPLQSASFGLPQIYQQGFGNPDYPAYTRPFTALFVQDSWNVASNLTLNYGVRYSIDSQFSPLNTYYKDFAPRVSFAWDPFNDHKTVIRGGYGIFYGLIDAQIPQVDLSLGVLNADRTAVENQHNASQVPDQVANLTETCGIGVTAFGPPGVIIPGNGSSPCNRYISIYVDPLTPTPLPFLQTSAQVFQGLFAQGLIQCTTPTAGNQACITPSAVAPYGIFAQNTGQISPLTVIFSNQPNYRPPYSEQASLGIQREMTSSFSAGISGIYSHTLHSPVAIDTNLLPSTPMSTVTLANGKTVSYRNWNTSAATDPLGGTEGLPCAPNPFACFVNPLIIQNNQYTSAASALYEGLILEMTKRFGNRFALFANYTFSKAFDTSTDFNSDYGPQDPTNLALDRGLSAFDERHKVVVAGVFESPWLQNPILSGFELSPIFMYHSGHPFNLLAGGEVNGDNHTTNERPIGAPRDTGLGPAYTDFDMRLTWKYKLTESIGLQLTAEGFNIANHTNYASVNNEVSPLFGFQPGFTTFNVHGITPNFTSVTPSNPLAFTSDFPKREIQLGLRLTF